MFHPSRAGKPYRIVSVISSLAVVASLVASGASVAAGAEPPMLGADPAYGESGGQTYVSAPETWVPGATESYVTIARVISFWRDRCAVKAERAGE